MMTTTKFTNNVVRAKAVKMLKVKKAGSEKNTPGSKFTNTVQRASVPAKTNTGQTGGGRSHAIGGKSGNSYGGAINKDNQVIRGY